jgi:hypothetical protein
MKCIRAAMLVILCIGFSPVSFAEISTNGPGSRFLFCEGLLTAGLKEHSTGESILASIRDLGWKFSKLIPKDATRTKSSEVIAINTRFKKLSKKELMTADARVREIDEALTETDLDLRLFALEIRGTEKINRAREALAQKIAALQVEYGGLSDTAKTTYPRFGEIRKSVSRFYYGSLVGLNLLAVMGLATHSLGPMIATMMLAVPFNTFSLLTWQSMKENSREFNYSKLQAALEKIVDSSDQERFAMFSQLSILPVEFDRAIFSQSDEIEKTRLDAVLELSDAISLWAFEAAHVDSIEQRMVANAGEPFRKILTDNIVYFDEQEKEPVWLVVYRSSRMRPAGKKPKKPVEEQKKQEYFEPDLVPGKA